MKLWIDLFAKHQLLDHAGALAFQILKSLIRLTLLGLALLGALGEQHVWRKTVAPAIKTHVQPATFHAIDTAVKKIFSTDSMGLIAFALLLSLWYISGSVRAVIGAMNQVYETEEDRPWPVRYAISLGLAACIAGGLHVLDHPARRRRAGRAPARGRGRRRARRAGAPVRCRQVVIVPRPTEEGERDGRHREGDHDHRLVA